MTKTLGLAIKKQLLHRFVASRFPQPLSCVCLVIASRDGVRASNTNSIHALFFPLKEMLLLRKDNYDQIIFRSLDVHRST